MHIVRTSSLDFDGALFQSWTGLVNIHIIEALDCKRSGVTSVQVCVPCLTGRGRNSHLAELLVTMYIFSPILRINEAAKYVQKKKDLTYLVAIVPLLVN